MALMPDTEVAPVAGTPPRPTTVTLMDVSLATLPPPENEKALAPALPTDSTEDLAGC